MEFQLTPGTEAPAEMNTWFPQKKALWMAENCTGTLHNLYTLRGAEVRDANKWSHYLMESLSRYGDEAQVSCFTRRVRKALPPMLSGACPKTAFSPSSARIKKCRISSSNRREIPPCCPTSPMPLLRQKPSSTSSNREAEPGLSVSHLGIGFLSKDNQYSYKGKGLSPAEALR